MWQVRAERPEDAAAIGEVHDQAFHPSPDEARLVAALRAAGDLVLSLVALHGATVVAHAAFSRARLQSGHPVLALAPLAVRPEHQRAGAGSALVREGLARAACTAFALVVVLGDPAYYTRFGFEPVDAAGVDAPFAVPGEAWMARRLPAYGEDARGRVVYPEAFRRLR